MSAKPSSPAPGDATPPVADDPASRPLWRSAARGFRGRCPRCGEGRLFQSFLKATPNCAHCGEALDGHRADDLPTFLTILVVGKLVAAAIVATETTAPLSLLASIVVWPCLVLGLTLIVVGRVKGAVIGVQWAHRMHGFSDDPDADEAARRA